MAQAAIRKATRIRNLWPSRELRVPPAPAVPAEPLPESLAARSEALSLRSFTAHELIAMARAARARSLDR